MKGCLQLILSYTNGTTTEKCSSTVLWYPGIKGNAEEVLHGFTVYRLKKRNAK